MPKAFSLASWNVEHFKNAPTRVADVIALLASLDPDVFALYEVEGKDVFGELVTQMPDYQFHIRAAGGCATTCLSAPSNSAARCKNPRPIPPSR